MVELKPASYAEIADIPRAEADARAALGSRVMDHARYDAEVILVGAVHAWRLAEEKAERLEREVEMLRRAALGRSGAERYEMALREMASPPPKAQEDPGHAD